jgi:MFS family permease
LAGVRFALGSPRLRRIIGAYAVNRLGTWIGIVALMIAVYDHTHNALAVAAMLVAAQALPAFLVPGLVARVEASRRRGELSGLYAFEALVTAALVVFVSEFSLAAVIVLVALDGIAARAANALLRAELARVAREEAGADRNGAAPADAAEAERAANAALNIAFSATFVSGPVIAGLIVAGTGASAALIVDAVSFLICAALLLDLRPHIEEAGSDTVRKRLQTAWRHINETPGMRMLLMMEMVAFVFFETGAPIEVAYAKETLQAGSRGFGILLATWGAGTVLGSIFFARSLRRPLGNLLSGGTLAVGIGYAGFAVAPSLAVACVAALVGGIGNGTELPSLFSIVQKITPANLHGRLMGAIESLSALCPLIGLPLGGALVALTTPRTAFLVVGIGTALAAFGLWRAVGAGSPTREDGEASPTEPPAAVPAPGQPEIPAH